MGSPFGTGAITAFSAYYVKSIIPNLSAVDLPPYGKRMRREGWNAESRLRCAGFIQSTGRSSASMCASSVPAASVSSADAPMVNPFAVYRMDGGTTRIVGLDLIITAARPASPTEKKRVRIRQTRVVLAAAHLDHNPSNNRLKNLKGLCQRCHLIHDRPHHLARRRITYLLRRALGDLFLGPYSHCIGLCQGPRRLSV